jgi:anti-anti-sigma factor
MEAGTDIEVLYPSAGAAVVECTGEHDMTTRDEVDRLFGLLVAENDLVVIDVSQAQFIDSSFVNNVLKADRLARQKAKVLRLQTGTSPIVRRVLEISGILEKLDCVDSRDEALRPVAAGGVGETELR